MFAPEGYKAFVTEQEGTSNADKLTLVVEDTPRCSRNVAGGYSKR